jgi:hypothetical protein
MMNKTKEIVENIKCLEYDEEKEQFTIEFNDIDEIRDAYAITPLVKTFIDYEILVHRKCTYEVDTKYISNYEVAGFAYEHLGESYTFNREWIDDCKEWIDYEY